MKLKEERWRENQLNVNDDQQSGAKPEGDVSHLVLLCFVLCVCVCVCVFFYFIFFIFIFFKKLFVLADFYFPPEMTDIRQYAASTIRNWLPWLRALVAMELKNYITILAPPKHKNNHTPIELNLFFFSFIATVHISPN